MLKLSLGSSGCDQPLQIAQHRGFLFKTMLLSESSKKVSVPSSECRLFAGELGLWTAVSSFKRTLVLRLLILDDTGVLGKRNVVF